MAGRGGGGRDNRFRRDYPYPPPPLPPSSRSSEEKEKGGAGGGRGNAPPSRHLWVGNLSLTIAEHNLTHHFLQFGELETIAFQRGRSYAFINFKREEDAIAALSSLQGFPLAGFPLKIEFTEAPGTCDDYDDDDDDDDIDAPSFLSFSFSFSDVGGKVELDTSGPKHVRRPCNRWTDVEVDFLKMGVTRFGHQWQQILSCPDYSFVNRTSVDLKDKWRNLKKNPKFQEKLSSVTREAHIGT